MAEHRLDRFLHARSIAIVGASEQGLYTAGILDDLVRYGYGGRLYPVNPRREQVRGLPCYASLALLPETPDLVIVVVGRERVLGVLDEALAVGVPAALIITAGFGESDAAGKQLEAELRQRLHGEALAVIGPNCAGFASVAGGIVATRLPAPPLAGGVGFVSASGALMMALQGLFADLHLGVSHLISLGNQVDVSLTEVVEYLVEDAATHTIGAFIEGIDDGPRFRAAALAAQRAGKPFVVVKSGRTQAGQRAAATHTAALAGSDRVFQAVCAEAGVILVEDVAELVRTLHLCACWQGRLPGGRRLALVTQSGGMGSLTADLATQTGFELPDLPPSLQVELGAMPHLLSFDAFGNPADVRGAGSVGAEAATTLAPFLEAPGFDVVMLLLAKSAVAARERETAQALAALAHRSARPWCVVWVGQRVPSAERAEGTARPLETLAAAGLPLFEQPGDCLRALARVRDFAAAQADAAAESAPATPCRAPQRDGGTSSAPRWLCYREIEELCAEAGIAPAPARVVATADEAIAAAEALGYPVAAKLLDTAQSHKSEAGLLRLNLADAAAVGAATAALNAHDSATTEGILIQKMARPGVEALIGVENDPQFGPVLVCGAGGVLVDLLDRVALRPAPLSLGAARAMIAETPLARLLAGYRGGAPGDLDALAELLVRVARVACVQVDRLVSLDLNPVIVHEQGLSIVDVRIAWRERDDRSKEQP